MTSPETATRAEIEQISPEQIENPLKRRIIELELENFKLNKYKKLYLGSEENRQMIAQKIVMLETELARCGKDVAALENVVEEHAKSEVLSMEEIIDSMVFVVPVQKLGKKIFAKEKVYFKFNGWTGELEEMLNDTEIGIGIGIGTKAEKEKDGHT